MTHLDDETLSVLIDSELGAQAAESARIHASTCPECGARLERLRAASASFKRSGEAEMPAGLAARAKAAAARHPVRPYVVLAGAIASLMLFLAAGAVLRTFMPTLFNSIQQMISGAASQMGSGSK